MPARTGSASSCRPPSPISTGSRKDLNDTNKQLQLSLQDVRPGLRNFSTQTLGDIGNLVGETRQLVTGLSRLATGIERDPSRVLFGDRREGYRPK